MLSFSYNSYHRTYEQSLEMLRHVVCASVIDWDGVAERGCFTSWPLLNSSQQFEFREQDFVKTPDMDKATSQRRLMWLDNDMLGLGPAEASTGDVISVLGGLQIPLVLRQVKEHFIIIGACYVHGIMDGERPWKENDICDIDIW